MRPVGDPASTVHPSRLAQTCGACHADPELGAQAGVRFVQPIAAYEASVHARGVAQGEKAATCSSCHGSHDILPAADPRSTVNRGRVPSTCAACHAEIAATFAASVHGTAAAQGIGESPVCVDCHGEHRILGPADKGSPVYASNVPLQTCGRCHGDLRVTDKFGLEATSVEAFADSFHGLASRAGNLTVANCASCHGVHDILPSSDPRSHIHAANLAATCGACHPGAGETFAIGAVHISPATASEHPAVRAIRWFYWLVIPLAVGFMVLHNGADFFAKLVRSEPVSRSGVELPRMNLHFRVAHWLVVASFSVLVVTGFALKFPEAWWARPLLALEGQLAFRGLLHRIAGVLLIGAMVYHLVHLALVPRDRVILRHLWPRLRDLRDMSTAFAWSFGRSPLRPTFGKFSYAEKIEYLAFVWGTVLMAVTGAMLWFNDWTLRFLPKWTSDAATAAHYYEAILATLSILVWHFYMVVFDPDVYPMDRAWLTGKTSADHLRHTRPQYAAELERMAQPPAAEAPAAPQEEEPPSA
jgi:cytochrome b subunit of formate dehydrogenase